MPKHPFPLPRVQKFAASSHSRAKAALFSVSLAALKLITIRSIRSYNDVFEFRTRHPTCITGADCTQLIAVSIVFVLFEISLVGTS
jgi:hypothetical protein